MDSRVAIENPVIDQIDQRFPLREVEADGRVFSYREHGDADDPAIVLLHGIGSASSSWAYQLDAFSDRYRVIAWDAPGYGNSSSLLEEPGEAPSAADYAVALGAFLRALDVEPEILVGHSLGALMAGAYAASGGGIGKALVVADPANGYGEASAEVREEKLSARLANIEKLGPEGLAAARASALLSPNASAEALEMVRWNMSKLRLDGHAHAAHMLAHGHLIGDAAKYSRPVLVMCGSEDTITPEEGCRKVADAFPSAIYKTLPGVGHASYVEGPEQFNAAVLEFVGGLDA